jgi:hypothetical protein
MVAADDSPHGHDWPPRRPSRRSLGLQGYYPVPAHDCLAPLPPRPPSRPTACQPAVVWCPRGDVTVPDSSTPGGRLPCWRVPPLLCRHHQDIATLTASSALSARSALAGCLAAVVKPRDLRSLHADA